MTINFTAKTVYINGKAVEYDTKRDPKNVAQLIKNHMGLE